MVAQPDTQARILAAVRLVAGPVSPGDVGRATGLLAAEAGVFLRALARDGYVVLIQDKPPLYAPAEAEDVCSTVVERIAVEVPRHGHAGIDDADVLDEIEAEKVWMLAGTLRAANTAWGIDMGIDMGIDADVREARALMAESRRQVRERAPVGEHYREQAVDGPPERDAPRGEAAE